MTPRQAQNRGYEQDPPLARQGVNFFFIKNTNKGIHHGQALLLSKNRLNNKKPPLEAHFFDHQEPDPSLLQVPMISVEMQPN
uniref:Uncharacterized protein n=1 Tax=Dreissena polymorpha TaxID=45954 RepID=A0A1P8NLW0_DREPO|nr:hypothetical protein [Dreissena polymorpha]